MIDICWYNHCYSYNENVKSLACSGGWTPKVLKVVLFWNCSQQCPGCAKQLKYYAKISALVYFLHKKPILYIFWGAVLNPTCEGSGSRGQNRKQLAKAEKQEASVASSSSSPLLSFKHVYTFQTNTLPSWCPRHFSRSIPLSLSSKKNFSWLWLQLILMQVTIANSHWSISCVDLSSYLKPLSAVALVDSDRCLSMSSLIGSRACCHKKVYNSL